MPRHRSLNLNKFIDSIPELSIKEYLNSKSEGTVLLDTYDSESVGSFLGSSGDEELSRTIGNACLQT